MSIVNDGGPAFPRNYSMMWSDDSVPGMSLRDYFAGQAICGLIGSDPTVLPGDVIEQTRQMARAAYWIADVMIEAREGKS